MVSRIDKTAGGSTTEKTNVLPFRYQFAAGAVAGIAEVSLKSEQRTVHCADMFRYW